MKDETMNIKPVVRLIASVSVLGLAMLLVVKGNQGYFIAVFLFFVPLFVNTMHKVSTRKRVYALEHKDSYFLKSLRQSRGFGYCIGFLRDFAVAMIVPVGVYLSSAADLLTLILLVPASLALSRFSRSVSSYRETYMKARMENLNEVLIGLISMLVYPFLNFFFLGRCGDASVFGSIEDFSGMKFARLVAVLFDSWNSISFMILHANLWWLLFLLLNGGILLYGLCRFFSTFMISKEDLTATISPLTNRLYLP